MRITINTYNWTGATLPNMSYYIYGVTLYSEGNFPIDPLNKAIVMTNDVSSYDIGRPSQFQVGYDLPLSYQILADNLTSTDAIFNIYFLCNPNFSIPEVRNPLNNDISYSQGYMASTAYIVYSNYYQPADNYQFNSTYNMFNSPSAINLNNYPICP